MLINWRYKLQSWGQYFKLGLRKGILLGGWYDNVFNFANTFTTFTEPNTCIGISIFVKLATKDANLGLIAYKRNLAM
ncbi:hypothetical protein CLI64_22700 [Nostoc sp. CENA543]|uniref:hypothetical protein n=1 Tax=Nostoc sp. CENA543 TaxID=1869241 RepID=UPI000CA1E4D6|nr:hypothetical protein [Nostoc sp. CENA543]AUT02988.1 hypothetical protein CLI64_22700 [Nostoc sp. CENA543]